MAALAVVAASLAGCGDTGSDASDGSGGSTDTGIVSVQSVDGSEVLVDSAGQTLYTADVEQGGRILCTGECTSFWAPVGTSASEAESAATALDLDLDVVERPDGDAQLTFEGLPLYTFTEEGPGQLTGDGFFDVFQGTEFEWLVATTGAGSEPASPEPSDDGGGFEY